MRFRRTISVVFWLIMLPGRAKNRVLNLLLSMLYGHRINLVWHDLKVVGALRRIDFGRNFVAGRGLWLETIQEESRILIGDNVNVSDWVHIGALNRVQIGDGCLLGSKVIVSDHSHGNPVPSLSSTSVQPPNGRPLHSKGPVFIGANVWIGDAAAIFAGVTIGPGAIIGANSVVTRDVPANTIWAGTPAVQIWPTSNT